MALAGPGITKSIVIPLYAFKSTSSRNQFVDLNTEKFIYKLGPNSHKQ